MTEKPCINSGSSLLNLALTGNRSKGWPLGRISNIIGDKSTGKTLLAIEAACLFLRVPPDGITPKILYLESEGAFDAKYAQSLGLDTDKVDFRTCDTVETMHDMVKEFCETMTATEGGLVIIDSLDGMSSVVELAMDIKEKTYSMAKQKVMSQIFRRLVTHMDDSKTHMMIISQVRENITTMPYSPRYVRGGGKALDFYCSHIVWLAERGKLVHTKTETVYGMNILANVSKNKVSPPHRQANFPILFGDGIDNTRSIINYLLKDPKDKAFVPGLHLYKYASGFYAVDEATKENEGEMRAKKLRMDPFIEMIEADIDLYRDLTERVGRVWAKIEEDIRPERPNRFDLLTG